MTPQHKINAAVAMASQSVAEAAGQACRDLPPALVPFAVVSMAQGLLQIATIAAMKHATGEEAMGLETETGQYLFRELARALAHFPDMESMTNDAGGALWGLYEAHGKGPADGV